MLNEGVQGNPSQQMTIFFVSLSDHHGKLQSGRTCNSGLPGLCIFVMTVSETIMVETIPYSNIGLTHCL